MHGRRAEASILHLDLDAFYAAVEQRDKPSLRGRPVIVGGTGPRGVVATASYEARRFGVRSAMPMHEARRRCPHAAVLAPRFRVYHATSEQVMGVLRGLSPRIEPLSLDEAFVDLRAADPVPGFHREALLSLVTELKGRVREVTGGLTASVGVATSKFVAKVAGELGKPDGAYVVEPGSEAALIATLPVSVIPGVGPVTAEKLRRLGVATVADLRRIGFEGLTDVLGRNQAHALVELANARDSRPVEPDRETKSISVEDTFDTDLVDAVELRSIADRDARTVAARLAAAGLFARTVTLKVRRHDFSTLSRSRTLASATDRAELIASVALGLLADVDTVGGVRLLGVGVAGLTDVIQEDLFAAEEGEGADADEAGGEPTPVDGSSEAPTEEARRRRGGWPPGADVVHRDLGRGWVWGAGLGRITVRFETAGSPPGPVRTFAGDDPDLRLAD